MTTSLISKTNLLASSKLTATHLARVAYVYIRQSSRGQVLNHRESTELQYKLVERAVQLGWPPARVKVIDEDLGKSAASMDRSAAGLYSPARMCASPRQRSAAPTNTTSSARRAVSMARPAATKASVVLSCLMRTHADSACARERRPCAAR